MCFLAIQHHEKKRTSLHHVGAIGEHRRVVLAAVLVVDYVTSRSASDQSRTNSREKCVGWYVVLSIADHPLAVLQPKGDRRVGKRALIAGCFLMRFSKWGENLAMILRKRTKKFLSASFCCIVVRT